MSFEGCIYGEEPDDPHYKLTLDDLKALQPQLHGLPVHVEHGARDIGRVTSSWINDDGRAYVRWEMADTPRGWGLAKLIDTGAVAQLSLKHVVFGDGSKRAIEVSVVEKGARPGTDITRKGAHSHIADAGVFTATEYITASSKHDKGSGGVTMDPAQLAQTTAYVLNALQQQQNQNQQQQQQNAPPPAAAAPAPAAAVEPPAPAAPAVTAAPTPAAQPAAAADEGAAKAGAKRTRDEEGRFAAVDEHETRRKKAATDAERLMKAAEAATSKLDPDSAQQLVTSMMDVLNNNMHSEKMINITQRELSDILAKVTDQKSTHRELAKDIVEGIVTLWGELTPERTVTASDKAFMQEIYESNPRFAILSQPMVVAASKVNRIRTENNVSGLERKLSEARELVSKMGSQLTAYGAAYAEPAPPPRWEAPAPVHAAAMGGVVAASAHAVPPPAAADRGMQMPAALAGMPAYNGTVGQMSLNDIRAPKI